MVSLLERPPEMKRAPGGNRRALKITLSKDHDNCPIARSQDDSDRRLERAIETARSLMCSSETAQGRRHHQQRWMRLLKARSPRRVGEMETSLHARLAIV